MKRETRNQLVEQGKADAAEGASSDALLGISYYLVGRFGITSEVAASIAQDALDAAAQAARDRPTPPGVGAGETADPGAHWAKRQEQAK